MKLSKVMGAISVTLSFVFFVLTLGFVGGMELDTIALMPGVIGALASALLWVFWLVLANVFWSEGF